MAAVAVQIGPVLYSASADGGCVLLGRWAPADVCALQYSARADGSHISWAGGPPHMSMPCST